MVACDYQGKTNFLLFMHRKEGPTATPVTVQYNLLKESKKKKSVSVGDNGYTIILSIPRF